MIFLAEIIAKMSDRCILVTEVIQLSVPYPPSTRA